MTKHHHLAALISHAVHSEPVRQVVDAVAAPVGIAAAIAHWVDSSLNPLFTAGVSLMTMVWFYYRIQQIRHNMRAKVKADDE